MRWLAFLVTPMASVGAVFILAGVVFAHETHDATTAASQADRWRTETCHLRGCQSLVASLLKFVDQTYRIYDPQSVHWSIGSLPLPEIHFVSRMVLAQEACPVAHCNALGWFPNKGNIVYMAIDQDVTNDLYARGILVHELVHYVQHMTGSPAEDNACLTWKARERQAYGIQHHWLRINHVPVQTPTYNLYLAGYSRMSCDDEQQANE